jgi:hypothetical protein
MHDGPIDLIVEAFGEAIEVEAAYRAAGVRFASVLDELCSELEFLRRPACDNDCLPSGAVARRMVAAVNPFATRMFITPMAAVAGAVAEEILERMINAAQLTKAYVNDGGDIALHLTPGEQFTVGMVELPEGRTDDGRVNPTYRKARSVGHPPPNNLFGTTIVDFEHPVRGIATSGWRGRSFSLGIADTVTVLARTASMSDAAATVIANAVDLPGHPAVERVRACELAPDTDLGELLVTQSVGEITEDEIRDAMNAGSRVAESLRASGLIRAAALGLKGEVSVVGAKDHAERHLAQTAGSPVHA